MSAIDVKYNQLGGAGGLLGNPTAAESVCPDGIGHYRHFDHGCIYWHPNTGAYEVHGMIRQRWSALGLEKSVLGYPKTDESTTPDGAGRYNHFEHGSIYWHPDTGAHEIHGGIRSLWSANGWETRIGYPKTDETKMNPENNGKYNEFQKGTIGWTPDHGAWFDFTGAGEGKFSGTLQLYKDADYAGPNHIFPVSTNCPIVFYDDLIHFGLHDKISSLKLTGIPAHCSAYLYENAKMDGRYLKINGSQNGALLNIAYVGNRMNDKLSSIQVVNHGLASVIFTAAQLQTLAAGQAAGIVVGGVEWQGSPKVSLVPGSRTIKIRMEGLIEETTPDSHLTIDIYFRPYVSGERLVKVQYVSYWANSEGSFAGYANSTILGKIDTYFKDHSAELTSSLNAVLATKLSALNSIPDFAKEAINVRRLNVLPEGLEIVLSDTDFGANLLKLANVEGLGTTRTAGQKTEGSV
jgi:hypothetical protein